MAIWLIGNSVLWFVPPVPVFATIITGIVMAVVGVCLAGRAIVLTQRIKQRQRLSGLPHTRVSMTGELLADRRAQAAAENTGVSRTRPRVFTPRHLGALTATACLISCLVPAGAGARGSCVSREVRSRLVHHVAPPQNFLSALSVLRRSQTPADLQGFDVNEYTVLPITGDLPTVSVIDADYIRSLGVVGGSTVRLIPARVQLAVPMSRQCLRRLSVKARRHRLKLERADRARGVVLLLAGGPMGGFPPSWRTYSQLINEGFWSSSQGADVPGVGYGIVPDGVSSVALLLEYNSGGAPATCCSPNVEITAQVTANFFVIEIPPPRLYTVGPATLIWRDASGRTLKSFPETPML
jgi:hypothetical protein